MQLIILKHLWILSYHFINLGQKTSVPVCFSLCKIILSVGRIKYLFASSIGIQKSRHMYTQQPSVALHGLFKCSQTFFNARMFFSIACLIIVPLTTVTFACSETLVFGSHKYGFQNAYIFLIHLYSFSYSRLNLFFLLIFSNYQFKNPEC